METGAVLLCYIAMLVYHLFEKYRVRVARERIGDVPQRLEAVMAEAEVERARHISALQVKRSVSAY